MSLADLRQNYQRGELLENHLTTSPFDQFQHWFSEARVAGVPEPNAMTLATVDSAMRPSARVVLLKGMDKRGFVFFTNYESRKGQDLSATGQAALLFFWPELERQIRIEGTVEKISAAESDAYFHSRPLGSRLGAWASPQSREIAGRAELEALEARAKAEHGDTPQRPPHWGGYRVVPRSFEFWQGRPSRLHDRLLYRLNGTGGWKVVRLAP